MRSFNEFAIQMRGKKISEIAKARRDEILESDVDAEEKKAAQIFYEASVKAEELLLRNIEGESNLYLTSALITAVLCDVPPNIVMKHVTDTLTISVALRRIHDEEFDERMSEIEDLISKDNEIIH